MKIELPTELDHRGAFLIEWFDSEGYTIEIHCNEGKVRQVHLRVIKDGKEVARSVKTFTVSELRGYKWASTLLHLAFNIVKTGEPSR